MTVPLRAALYLRASTARQAEYDVSIPGQRRQGEAYCGTRGYQLVETYVEPGAKRRPVLLLIGDDDDDASTGPAGWNCACRLPWWARAATLLHRRLVMVETNSAHIPDWTALFLNRVPLLTIQPPDAGPHPAPVPREAMQ